MEATSYILDIIGASSLMQSVTGYPAVRRCKELGRQRKEFRVEIFTAL